DEHVVGAPDTPHARAGPTAGARARPDLDVVPGAKAEEWRGAMPEMRQHELAGRAVVHRDRSAGLGVDQLGVDEPARTQVHPVLLLALPPERNADVADAHR